MHLPRLLLAALLCFALGPAAAQEGDDDSGVEVSEDPKPGEEKPAPPDDGYDEEKAKKRDVGLAGRGGGDEGDADAPKVQADLQTRINEAIARGVVALKKMQDDKGSWGPVKATQSYDGSKKGDFVRDELGPTAWALYTLAKCGVKKNDQVMQNGLRWIEENTKFVFDVVGIKPNDPDPATLQQKNISKKNPRSLTTYESAAIVLMIEAVYEESAKLTGKQSRRLFTEDAALPPKGSKIPKNVWPRMHDRIRYLTVGRTGIVIEGRSGTTNIPGQQNREGKNRGGWRYGGASGDADLSATQFVLLALRAASQAGYPVEKTAPQVWQQAAEYVRACQNSDGGFGYQVGTRSYASMTACGVGSLLICREQLTPGPKDKDKAPPPDWMDGAIKSGMEWLDKNFDAETNAGAPKPELFYYLYGIERVGDLAGRKEFNGKDWYLRGAMLLLERQEADGKWRDATGFPPHDVLGTCFALLFLKRATPPVVTMGDRDVGSGGD